MLEVDPQLTARDVMRIFSTTSRKIDSSETSWQFTGAGKWYSPKYGFGVADADAAVVLSETWRETHPESSFVVSEFLPSPSEIFPQSIPDHDSIHSKLLVSLQVPEETSAETSPLIAEGVTVRITARHPRRGELKFTLTSPRGTKSVFEGRSGDRSSSGYTEWDFYTVANWDEPAAGTWTLVAEDTTAGNRGDLASWSLVVYGRRSLQ